MSDNEVKEVKKTAAQKETVKFRVQKLFDNAPLPVKPKTSTDSGFDVVAHNLKMIYAHFGSNGEKLIEGEFLESKFVEPGVFELQQGERALIGTGLKMTVSEGYEIQVRPRSGNALKRGLTCANAIGTIDYEYRNEVGVILLNTSRQTQRIRLGETIAQVVPMKVELIELIEEDIDDHTVRGKDGYGSTNKIDRHRNFTNEPIIAIVDHINDKNTPFNMM
jgi:dUTP pyrophosphatase